LFLFSRYRRNRTRGFRNSYFQGYPTAGPPQTHQISPYNLSYYSHSTNLNPTQGQNNIIDYPQIQNLQPVRYSQLQFDQAQHAQSASPTSQSSSTRKSRRGPRIGMQTSNGVSVSSFSPQEGTNMYFVDSPSSDSHVTQDRMQFVRHQDAGPYRVTELPPLYQELSGAGSPQRS